MGKPTVGPAVEEARGGVLAQHSGLMESMSILMAAERGSAEMYRKYAREANDPALRRQWEQFGQRAQGHVHLTEGTITTLRGDVAYVSEGAREVEKCVDTMLTITTGDRLADLFRLSHLVTIESLARQFWRGVNRVAPQTRDPSLTRVLRDTAVSIERDENQHMTWNSATFYSLVARFMTVR